MSLVMSRIEIPPSRYSTFLGAVMMVGRNVSGGDLLGLVMFTAQLDCLAYGGPDPALGLA
jgi:hypothetical protein